MQTNTISHPKNAARFIETVRARAPRGFSDAVKQAAEANQLSTSEFVRRALAGAIELTAFPRDGGPIETVELLPLEAARRLAFALEKGRRALEGETTR